MRRRRVGPDLWDKLSVPVRAGRHSILQTLRDFNSLWNHHDPIFVAALCRQPIFNFRSISICVGSAHFPPHPLLNDNRNSGPFLVLVRHQRRICLSAWHLPQVNQRNHLGCTASLHLPFILKKEDLVSNQRITTILLFPVLKNRPIIIDYKIQIFCQVEKFYYLRDFQKRLNWDRFGN